MKERSSNDIKSCESINNGYLIGTVVATINNGFYRITVVDDNNQQRFFR